MEKEDNIVMKKYKFFFICGLIDKLLHLQKYEDRVTSIKQDAHKKVDKVTRTLQKSGKLQNQILRKTTTYYIGRAAGVVK